MVSMIDPQDARKSGGVVWKDFEDPNATDGNGVKLFTRETTREVYVRLDIMESCHHHVVLKLLHAVIGLNRNSSVWVDAYFSNFEFH